MRRTRRLLEAPGLWLVSRGALNAIFVPAGGLRSLLRPAVVIRALGLMALWARDNRGAIGREEWREE